MKKQTMQKVFLVLLPILAVGLATTRDSVTVLDTRAGVTEFYSYFEMLPEGALRMLTPLAAVLSLASGVLAGLYAAVSKEWAVKGVFGTAFCAATAAALPILMRGDILVVPNVFFPILMGAECILAYVMRKKPAKQEEEKAPRLNRR